MDKSEITISLTPSEASDILSAFAESGRPGFYTKYRPIWIALKSVADKIEDSFSSDGFDFDYNYDSGHGTFTSTHPLPPTYSDGTTCACEHPFDAHFHHSATFCRSLYTTY
jgi:hypothetical protein